MISQNRKVFSTKKSGLPFNNDLPKDDSIIMYQSIP